MGTITIVRNTKKLRLILCTLAALVALCKIRSSSPGCRLEYKVRKHIWGIPNQPLIQRVELWKKYEQSFSKGKMKNRLPDVIIIGVEKCGTGPLQEFLRRHPAIKFPERELFFFHKTTYNKTEEYLSQLPMVRNYHILFEKTPTYYKMNNGPHRIRNVIPKAKIIFMMCDPVNRSYSDFLQHKSLTSLKDIDETFDEYMAKYIKKLGKQFFSHSDDVISELLTNPLIAHGSPHLLTAGMYYYYLRLWLKEYQLDKDFLILDGESFLTEPWKTMETVQRFLGLPIVITQNEFTRMKSSHLYCISEWPKMDPDEIYCRRDYHASDDELQLIRETVWYCPDKTKGRSRFKALDWNPEPLRRIYASTNKKLFKYLGRKFDWA